MEGATPERRQSTAAGRRAEEAHVRRAGEVERRIGEPRRRGAYAMLERRPSDVAREGFTEEQARRGMGGFQ
jgi:hypothetical protein